MDFVVALEGNCIVRYRKTERRSNIGSGMSRVKKGYGSIYMLTDIYKLDYIP